MNFLRPREEEWLLTLTKPLHDDLVTRLPLKTGLSPAELADLRVTDVHYEYSVIFVWRSKTSTDHLALVDKETLLKLWEYADKRKKGALLKLEGSRRMRVQAMRRTVKHWAREAGISRWNRVTPYTLRHTFCIKWIMAGGTLEGLRRQLGLRSLQKLRNYLDFDYSHVKAEYQRIIGDIVQLTRSQWTLPTTLPYVM